MFKILLAAFALLAVASATDVYSAFYTNGDCTGAAEDSLKSTLGQCFSANTASATEYRRVSFDGTDTYSIGFYSDSDCQTTLTTVDSANPFTGSADACTEFTYSSVAKSAKILSGSDYASNSEANYDCTSGQCVEITNEPTNAPTTNAPTLKTEWYTATYSDDQCSAVVLGLYKFTLGQCSVTNDTSNPWSKYGSVNWLEYGDVNSPDASITASKLTLDGSTYSFDVYSDSTCTTRSVWRSTFSPAQYTSVMSPSPITGAADACSAFTIIQGAYGSDFSGSFKVLSLAAETRGGEAEALWDCTSGSCVDATNSAGKRSSVPLPCALSHALVFSACLNRNPFCLPCCHGSVDCIKARLSTPNKSTKHKWRTLDTVAS